MAMGPTLHSALSLQRSCESRKGQGLLATVELYGGETHQWLSHAACLIMLVIISSDSFTLARLSAPHTGVRGRAISSAGFSNWSVEGPADRIQRACDGMGLEV